MPALDFKQYLGLISKKNAAVGLIATNAKQILSANIPSWVPHDYAQSFVDSYADLLAHHIDQELAQFPHLDPGQYPSAQKSAVTKAVNLVKTTNHDFYNLFSSRQAEQLASQINQSLSKYPSLAQSLAEKSTELKELEQTQANLASSPQNLSAAIFDKVKNNYGLTQENLQSALEKIPRQVANHPVPTQIDQALENNLQEQGAAPDVIEQFKQEIESFKPLIHRYAQKSVSNLPRQTPFTPFKPGVDFKTQQQAAALRVDSLALAYFKTGFATNHSQVPVHLRADLELLENLISDPLNSRHRVSFSSRLTAASLAPQRFVSKNYYFPVYQAHQNALAKANQFLEKPYGFYQNVNQHYQSYKTSYRQFTAKHPLGWVVAPRYRFRLAVADAKIKLAKDFKQFVVKHPRLNAGQEKLSHFWGEWSPAAVKRRFTAFLIQKSGEGLIWLGRNLGLKFLITAGTAVLGTASIIGIPLVVLQTALSASLGFFGKLKQQVQKQKLSQDAAGIAAKGLQTVFGALKALAALVFGSAWGFAGILLGGFIGFLVAGPLGLFIGALAGGLSLGSLGALIGYNWFALLSIPFSLGASLFGASGLFSGGMVIGSSAAAAANITATTGLLSVAGAAVESQRQIAETTKAFFLPETGLTNDEDTPPDIVNPEGQWLSWPYANKTTKPTLSQCYGSSNHAGLDTSAGDAANVYPAAPGKVVFADGKDGGSCLEFGACVIINHNNGWYSIYGHLNEFSDGEFITVGNQVTTNTLIGTQDRTGLSTGSHLHFGLSKGSSVTDFYWGSGITTDPCPNLPNCSCP